jgi:type IV pilus assembly protein PilP
VSPLRPDGRRGLATRAAAAAAAALVLLAGCGDSARKPPPAKPGAAAVAQKPAVAPTGEAAKPAPPEWSYSSVGKRDPFRSFLAELGQTQSGLQTRCATPLGRFELEQLRLVAVVTGLEDPVAMVEAPSGVGYAVRRGACIGKNGGVVAAVRTGEVVVTEWAIRADGTRDRTQTSLRLPREAAMNLEEQP